MFSGLGCAAPYPRRSRLPLSPLARPSPRRLLAACALASLLSALAPRAYAAARLSLSRAEQAMDCPDEAALVASIERILGRREFSPAEGAAPVLVEVRFVRGAEGYEGTVRLVGPKQGVRVLRDPGPTCAPLAEAVAVTVALLLDHQPGPAAAPSAAPAAPSAPSASSAPPAVSPSHEPGPARVLGALTAGAALGLVERPSWALGAEAAVELRRVGSLAVGGYWVAPQELPTGQGSVQVSLASGYLRACARVASVASARASLCGGFEAGVLRGDSDGFRRRSPATLPWVAAEAGAELGGDLGGRWLWAGRAMAVVPVRKQSFSVGFVGVGYESPSVGALLQVALGARLFLRK